MGITKEVACLQQTPHGDFAVVYIEANYTSKILQDMLDSNDAFHTLFKQAVMKDCYVIGSGGLVPPSNEVFLDLL